MSIGQLVIVAVAIILTNTAAVIFFIAIAARIACRLMMIQGLCRKNLLYQSQERIAVVWEQSLGTEALNLGV
jgi:hypothetical protein